MLHWIVDKKVADSVLKDSNVLILEDQIETRPEKVPDGIIDENVDIHLIRRFLTNDAWLVLKQLTEMKRSTGVYLCRVCFKDLHEMPSIICDHCLNWQHLHCVGLKCAPKTKHWYCRPCCVDY